MVRFTSCNRQYRAYELTDDLEERNRSIQRALRRFLPKVEQTESSFGQITWHLDTRSCDDQNLRPLSELVDGEFNFDANSGIHLHEPRPHPVHSLEPLSASEPQISDSETRNMNTDVSDDQLHVRVIYNLKSIRGLKLAAWRDIDNPPEEVLHFSRQHSLPSLFSCLTEFVERKLAADELGYFSTFEKNGNRESIFLHPLLKHDCALKQRAFTFDKSGVPRVASIGDLVSDQVDSTTQQTQNPVATQQDIQPQLTLELRMINVIPRESATNPTVVIRSAAERGKLGGGAQYYHIVARAAPQGSQAVESLDTYFWCCELGGGTGNVKVVKAPTWSLRGLDICDPEDGARVTEDPGDSYGVGFEGPATLEDLRRGLEERSIRPHVEGRLLYSFKTWRWDLVSPDSEIGCVEFPKSVKCIPTAIRFVNRLRQAAQLDLPWDIEVELKDGEGYDTFCKKVVKILKKHNAELFEEALRDFWKFEVWIMPQADHVQQKVLYRYMKGADLFNFLRRSYVGKEDASLFGESHLIPERKRTSRGRETKRR